MLQYAPKQQLLITGGRKGFVCVFDIRQRQLLHTFQAHDSAIKALALDAFEDFFVTGSAEGNMKVTHAPSHTHTQTCQNTSQTHFEFVLRIYVLFFLKSAREERKSSQSQIPSLHMYSS